jgi:hypothetical protein
METDYSDYIVIQSPDPTYWGPDTTNEQTGEFNNRLSEILRKEFPKIVIERGVRYRGVIGPDDDVREDILQWINSHYPDACTD